MTQSTAATSLLPTTLLALFVSSGTLICCALPITLVTLGFGATVASLSSAFPFLVNLSEYKTWVFVLSALMLLIAGLALFRPGRSCPSDPALGAACARSQRWGRYIWWLSVSLFCIGFFAAYLALPLLIWFEP